VYKRKSGSGTEQGCRLVWMPTAQSAMVYECVYGVLKALQSGDCESVSALLLGRSRSANDDSTFVAPSCKRCVFRSIARQAGQPFWPSPNAAFSACPAFTQENPAQTRIDDSLANISNVSPGLKKGWGSRGLKYKRSQITCTSERPRSSSLAHHAANAARCCQLGSSLSSTPAPNLESAVQPHAVRGGRRRRGGRVLRGGAVSAVPRRQRGAGVSRQSAQGKCFRCLIPAAVCKA
jgi:hypothetical protein